MSQKAVLYRREGRVGVITLNRPHRLNAINVNLLRGLMAHLETASEDREAHVVMKLGKPLIAAVNGYALGGGCEFAMSCDIRIAGESARFGFPETGVGLTVTTAGTKLLTQLVGLGKAKELIFAGDFIDATEAERIGLANRVVPDAQLMEEAVALAEKIAERSPLALKLSRIAIDQGLDAGFDQILEIEANHLLICTQAQNQDAYVARRLEQMKKKKE